MCVSIKNLIYICIIVSFVPSVFSIKCWTCRSSTDPKCADPFDNSTVPISDCNQEKGLSHLPGVRPTMCRKIRQKVDGRMEVSRSCATIDPYGTGDQCANSSYGPVGEVSSCILCNDRDGCNGAAALGKTIAVITIPLALLLFK